MKKILRFLSSMPFAIALLILLAAACAFSSTVTQGQDSAYYAAYYGERTAGLIMALHLDDAFHSWWFIGLSAALCLNLLCCNVLRLPVLIRRSRAFSGKDVRQIPETADTMAREGKSPEKLFSTLRLFRPGSGCTEDGRETLTAVRGRAGLWGAWVCHLGILLLILGFALGQLTMRQYPVTAMPGQTKPLGDTGLFVTVNDFRAETREDGSPIQYTADLTVADPQGGTEQAGTASVNSPATLYGYSFFQNSYGWGADARVLKNGKELQLETLCPGEYFPVKDKPDLVILLMNAYPDYDRRGEQTPASAEGKPENPAYVYQVYYQGQILGMNVLQSGEELTIDEYTVRFENLRYYTLLMAKRDNFTFLVLLGGLVTLAGLVLAFYLRPVRALAVREAENTWTVYAWCRKGGILFREEFEKAASEAEFRTVRSGTDASYSTTETSKKEEV